VRDGSDLQWPFVGAGGAGGGKRPQAGPPDQWPLGDNLVN
jgi:hypothetical protein